MREWKDILEEDAKSPSPQWTAQERDVMMAAYVCFRVIYKPKDWGTSKLHQYLKVWRRGLQADTQSPRPRWLAQDRAAHERIIKLLENGMAEQATARKEAEQAKMDAWWAKHQGFWGKLKLVVKALGALVAMFALLLIINLLPTLLLVGLKSIFPK